jgi:uncharacterized protein YraI
MANRKLFHRSPRSSHPRRFLAASISRRLAHIALAIMAVAAITLALPQPTNAQACTPTLIARADTIMRQGPGTRYRTLAVLLRGEGAQVTGRLRNNTWYLVAAKGITGWVSRQTVTTSCTQGVPVSPATPVQPTNANIVTPFTASRFVLPQGQCAILSWRVREVAGVFLMEGNTAWQGVAGESARNTCPAQTTLYTLRTQRRDGSTFDQSLAISVASTGAINPNFRADNPTITPGQCTTLRWNIDNVQGVWLWNGNNRQGIAGNSSQAVCPAQTQQYRLEVLQRNGVTSNFFVTVTVDASALSASITDFSVDNAWLVPNQCTGMRWTVTGTTKLIQLIDRSYVTTVGATGAINVCPGQTTTYILRVFDASGRQIDRALTVNVNAPAPQPNNPTPIP